MTKFDMQQALLLAQFHINYVLSVQYIGHNIPMAGTGFF